MIDHYFHSPEARSLAASARTIGRGNSVLFHGTPSPKEILDCGALLPAESGMPSVSFSRSADVAGYWAVLPREEDFKIAAILVFDRETMRSAYRLEPFSFFERQGGELQDEMEEIVFGRSVKLSSARLIGIAYLLAGETTSNARLLSA